MTEQVKLERRKKITKIILVTVTVLFIFVMLVVPLFSVMASALKEGFGFYLKAISTSYVLSALKVTLIATVFAVVINTFFGIWTAWLLTRFSFKGKQVLATLIDIPFSISPVIVGLAYLMTFGRLGWFYPVIRWFNEIFGTNVRITFAIPGVVLATIFVTFPYVSREIIPVLNAEGKDEEEAAALMGASGFTIFRKITLPQMKWSLIYGIILCTARALGEFGAVNALSKTRGETFTLPLEIDALYMSGTDSSITSAFAVSSILLIIALIILFARNIVEPTLKYMGTQGTSGIKIYEKCIASTGLTEEVAKATTKMNVGSVELTDNYRPEFMPTYLPATVKLVFDKDTRRVIGGQIISDIDLTQFMNTLSVVIQNEMTIEELAMTDFFFQPHFNKPWSILNAVALKAL